MLRHRAMVAGAMLAGLAFCALASAAVADETPGTNAEASGPSDEGLEDAIAYLAALLDASPLKGLTKVEALLDPGPVSSEWEEALGISAAEVNKHVKSRVAGMEGLDATGSEMDGDPVLSLRIEPLVERDDAGKPTRVFVSVALCLHEWVMVERPEDDWGFSEVMATTWREHRLVSGPPVDVLKEVEAAATELLDAFERSYLESNKPKEPSEATDDE